MPSRVKRSGSHPTVLVVDDDPDVALLMSRILSRRGCRVVCSLSGEDALSKVKHLKPDIIFMDIMMPTMNGWECARAIKEDDETSGIPIIMISVRKDPEDIERSLKYAHADAHITKPIRFEKVYEAIERYTQAA